MVVEEAEGDAPDVGSHHVLSADGYREAVPVGEPESLLEQMDELAQLLREFAVTCSTSHAASGDRMYYDANKQLYRAVESIQRFVNEYR